MSNATEDKQEFTFQTEIAQLLKILSHSLYQNRDITIRELVSNASDALDKMRFLQLSDEKLRDEVPLAIHLEPDKENRVLTIRDNGIGMTREELVSNLGTIAHSGSLDFLNKLSGSAEKDLSLIGQFGVGFYSAFMLADRVEVLTRSYQEKTGWKWESAGTGSFSIEPAEELERGTQIRLYLKEDLDEFAEPLRLKTVIRKYSTFVPHPIHLEDEQLNDQRPIWVEPKSQLTDEQYEGFFQYLSHRHNEKPLWHLHLSADSPIQFHTILYCPETNFELLGFGRNEHGLHLCAKRILVQDDCRELLPEYLRFVYGIVDSADLPLNVSRQALQDDTVFLKIRKVLVKRVLDHLGKLAEQDADRYWKFYQQFGPVLREGVTQDFENRVRVAELMRLHSSQASEPDERTSLAEYVGRMKEDQKQIYYLCGTDLGSMGRSPNLEIFRKNDLEVLYLIDPLDEVILTNLGEYESKRLMSIDAADVELPESVKSTEEGGDDTDSAKSDLSPAGFQRVLELFRQALGDRVEEVRESKRLTDSPCCLVNPSGNVSAQLQRVIQMTNQDYEMSKRIFEINPRAALIKRLCDLSANPDHNQFVKDCGLQLFSNALLLEGMAPDTEELVDRIKGFMEELATKRSPIIT